MSRPLIPPTWATDSTFLNSTDPATGNPTPWSGQPNKAAPAIAEGFESQSPMYAEHHNYLWNLHGQWLPYLGENAVIYDDRGVGAFNTIGAVTTMNADIHCSSITVGPSADGLTNGILYTMGYRIFCSGTITVQSGGSIICNNVTAATGFTGGAAGPNGSMLGGAAGGNGKATAGDGGVNITQSYGGVGGAAGSGPNGGGGAAGGLSAPEAFYGSNLDMPALYTQYLTGIDSGVITTVGIRGGSGGGGGGGDVSGHKGGGGGAGGGLVLLVAHDVVNNGVISSVGMAGAAGTGGNSGGGGGGGGGVVVVATRTFSGTDPIASGGVGGHKSGTGSTVGADGAPGSVFIRLI